MQILPVTAEIEEKIADQLPGPVISRLPAAIDRDERMRQMRGAAQTRLIGGAADGVNRLVLEKPEFVGRVRIRALPPDQFILLRECVRETRFGPTTASRVGLFISEQTQASRRALLPARADE